MNFCFFVHSVTVIFIFRTFEKVSYAAVYLLFMLVSDISACINRERHHLSIYRAAETTRRLKKKKKKTESNKTAGKTMSIIHRRAFSVSTLSRAIHENAHTYPTHDITPMRVLLIQGVTTGLTRSECLPC